MTRFAPPSRTCSGAINRMDATTGLTRKTARDSCDEFRVITLAHRRVEVDQLHQRKTGELFDPILEVVEGEAQLFTLNELHYTATQEIDRRDQQGHLTATPALASSCLSERALETPK